MNLLLHIILFHRKTSHDCQSKKYRNLLQHGQLITTNSLLTSLPNEINDNTINNVKHYSLIMCGVNYHREVYQNMDCKQFFILHIFWYSKWKKCERAYKLCNNFSTTIFLQQWIWYNVTYVKSGITGTIIKPNNV